MKDLGWKLRVLFKRLFVFPEISIGASMQMEGYSDWEIDEELYWMRRSYMEELKQLLLDAPDHALDDKVKDFVRAWSNPVKAIEVLKVLDICVYAGAASKAVMAILRVLYEHSLKNEGKTHEDMIPLATWRTNGVV